MLLHPSRATSQVSRELHGSFTNENGVISFAENFCGTGRGNLAAATGNKPGTRRTRKGCDGSPTCYGAQSGIPSEWGAVLHPSSRP